MEIDTEGNEIIAARTGKRREDRSQVCKYSIAYSLPASGRARSPGIDEDINCRRASERARIGRMAKMINSL